MIKSKSRLAIKLFIIVWVVLAVHIALKLTFNYWQPYVISSDRLQTISDFIDNNRWLQATLNGIWYLINGLVMILAGIQCWWFKNKKQSIITISTIIICFFLNIFLKLYDFTPLITTLILPLALNYKKWLPILITFALNNVFLLLSLWLEGFTNANQMNYVIRMFLQFDYYIMLFLNYFVFNLINKGEKNNG